MSARDAQVQAASTAHRPYLLAVAAGMLKRRDDAEDVVQEAFARLTASPHAIEDVRGWLVVVTRRLCLDRLDLAENRRTTATAEPPEAAGELRTRRTGRCFTTRCARRFPSWSTGSLRRSGPRSSSTTSSASPSTLDPEVASFPVVIGLPPMPAVRGAEAVAARVMHRFGPLAGIAMQPFDLEGRAAVVVRRGDEVVAVVRLDDRDGRIIHVHTVARPSLAR